MDLLLVLAVVAAVVITVTGPLRHAGRTGDEELEAERAELEAAKEAKYREIRDAELDYRTGKLSEADWRAMDRVMRAEAVELLKRLDSVDERAESLP